MDFVRISFFPLLSLFFLLQIPARLALSLQQKEGSSLNQGREEDEREREFEISKGRIIGGSPRELRGHLFHQDLSPWARLSPVLSREREEEDPFSSSSSSPPFSDVDRDKETSLAEKIKILPPIPYDEEEEEKNLHRNATLSSLASFLDLHQDDREAGEGAEHSHAFLEQASQEKKKKKMMKDRWLSKYRELKNVLDIQDDLDRRQHNAEQEEDRTDGVDRYSNTYYSPFFSSSSSSSPSSSLFASSSLESFNHLSPVSQHGDLERNPSLSDLSSAVYDAPINNTSEDLLLVSPSSSSSSLVENSSSLSQLPPRSDIPGELEGSRIGGELAVRGEQQGGVRLSSSSFSLPSSSSSSLSPQLLPPSIAATALPENGARLASYSLSSSSPSLHQATPTILERSQDPLKNSVLPPTASTVENLSFPFNLNSSLLSQTPSAVSSARSPSLAVGSAGSVSEESLTSPSSPSRSTSSSSSAFAPPPPENS